MIFAFQNVQEIIQSAHYKLFFARQTEWKSDFFDEIAKKKFSIEAFPSCHKKLWRLFWIMDSEVDIGSSCVSSTRLRSMESSFLKFPFSFFLNQMKMEKQIDTINIIRSRKAYFRAYSFFGEAANSKYSIHELPIFCIHHSAHSWMSLYV